MPFLLLPDDERLLIDFLTGELGLRLLASEVAPGGEPSCAASPGDRISDSVCAASEVLTFWAPAVGPVLTYASSPVPSADMDAADRVSYQLTRASAGTTFPDVIDVGRTPVLRWRRPYLRSPTCLVPALLQTMPLKIRQLPPELLRLFRTAEAWLKSRSVRVNPFDHCTGSPVPAPRNLSPFWVWALEHGRAWLESGREVWPWTA